MFFMFGVCCKYKDFFQMQGEWGGKREKGKAPSISPIRGSARLPLSDSSDNGSDSSDWSDWSDKQFSQQPFRLVRPVRLVRRLLKLPEKLTRGFLLKDGKILWVALSVKIFAAFLILQAGKVG